MFDVFLVGLINGAALSLVACAVMIPFRIIALPDLTSEGSYLFGGAVCAVALGSGLHPVLSVILAACTSSILGLCTGIIYLRFKIHSLLAGIIVSTMAYSVILRIMGKPNISLFAADVLFSYGGDSGFRNLLILGLFILAVIIPLAIFLRTEVGLRLRALGHNIVFARKYSISVPFYTLIGLAFSASLAGMAGGLMVQLQNYVDVGMGVGITIHALAALMIGESILGNSSLHKQLIAPLLGSLVYQQIQGLAFSIGLAPSDLKLFTGIIIILVLEIRSFKTAGSSSDAGLKT